MKGRVPRRKASIPVKVFTLEDANRLLPRIEEAVLWFRDAVEQVVAIQDRISVLDLIGGGAADSPERLELEAARAELEERVGDYNRRLEDFHRLGCLIKDVEHGLVDFYGMKDGRLVFLCWRLGEKKISYWHEINAGAAGRRPVSEL